MFLISILFLLQGNQEAPAPPEAMAQAFPPAQYPPPPQNGMPAEYATPHTHPPTDFTGPNTVGEHALTLYTPTHTQSEQPVNDSSVAALTANTVTVSQHCKQRTPKILFGIVPLASNFCRANHLQKMLSISTASLCQTRRFKMD